MKFWIELNQLHMEAKVEILWDNSTEKRSGVDIQDAAGASGPVAKAIIELKQTRQHFLKNLPIKNYNWIHGTSHIRCIKMSKVLFLITFFLNSNSRASIVKVQTHLQHARTEYIFTKLFWYHVMIKKQFTILQNVTDDEWRNYEMTDFPFHQNFLKLE